MFSVWRWRSHADARRSRRARFRVLLAATCHECSHPFVEHIPDAHPLDDHVCSECVYEVEHGLRSGPPCRQPIPADLLHRAEAAALMPETSGGGDRRRRSDTERPRESSAANLREATAALMLGLVTTRDVVALAADQLAAGDDGASLCALASLYADATPCDVFDLSSAALVEAGERPLDRGGEEVPLLALRVACRRFLAGGWKLRGFSSWVHDRIGHTGPDAAQPLVEFDDELDARNGKADREYHARAVRLAAAFLAETGGFASDTRNEGVYPPSPRATRA